MLLMSRHIHKFNLKLNYLIFCQHISNQFIGRVFYWQTMLMIRYYIFSVTGVQIFHFSYLTGSVYSFNLVYNVIKFWKVHRN